MPSTDRAKPPLETYSLPQNYEVQVARTDEEVRQLAPTWEQLTFYPNAQVDFFRLINSLRASVIRPHVISVSKKGQICALAVARLVEHDFTCSIGYKTWSFGKVRQLDVIHGGLLGDCSGVLAGILVREWVAALKRGEADVVSLSFIDAASDVFKTALREPSLLCRDRVIRTQLHWKARLPDTLEAFLKRLNKKHRYWLRRLEKTLNTDFPGMVTYKSFADYGSIEALADDLESIAKKTYQRGLGAGFIKDDEYLRRLTFGNEQGWLRGVVLHIDSKPRAFWMGSVYRKVFHSEATGYDPEFRNYELGTLVFLKMAEYLCMEMVEAIDFGLGDALYKRRFGDEHWEEGNVLIFSPTFRGVKLNLTRTLLEGAALRARRLISRLGLEQRLKTLWKRKIADDGDAQERSASADEES